MAEPATDSQTVTPADQTPTSSTAPALQLRDALPADLDALLAIENEVFDTDRISRRSFRTFITSPRATLRVATLGGEVAGYHLVLSRRGTAAARLYSLAVTPKHRGEHLGAALLDDAEDAAYAADRATMRLEVSADNTPARRLYERAGYHEIARLPGYYEDGSDGLRMEKILRGDDPHTPGAPFYEQTTDFTCGPACLMMVLAARRPGYPLTPMEEVKLWRRATTVFMTSGLGGCDPYGLAVTLAEEGLCPEIWVTEEGSLMQQTVRNAEKRKVMDLAQRDFQERVEEMGIPVHLAKLEVGELGDRVAGGALAILLVSGNQMFGKRVPHWLLAHAADDHHVFLHDPWVEDKDFESATDAADIPTPYFELDRMWHWGQTRLRAAVLIPPDLKGPEDRK